MNSQKQAQIIVLFFIFPVLIFLPNSTLTSYTFDHDHPYAHQAEHWTRTYLSQASNEDLELVANMFYWSYQRSVSTLEAQEAAIEALQAVWQSWLNVSSTRLNPSCKPLYEVHEHQALHAVQLFDKAQARHHEIGLIYASCIEALVKDTIINPSIRQALLKTRADARRAVYHGLFKHVTRSSTIMGDPQKEHQTTLLKVLKNFWRVLPSITVTSLVLFDKKYNELSNRCWHNFMKAHKHINILWRHIEESRALFYQSYYQATFKYISHTFPHLLPLRIAFNKNGYIPPAQRSELLPPSEI